MLSLSWINLPNISISGLIILVATFTLLALLPRSFYFHSILRDRLILRHADPQVYDFPFSILSIIGLLNYCYPCQITATTNVRNHFYTQYALFPCSFKYCQLLELCKLCCPRSAIHFAVVRQGYYNSKDLVVGCVSGVVVDNGGHAVWLPSVTLNVVVNGGCLLMRGS